jgi:hypothetical protein
MRKIIDEFALRTDISKQRRSQLRHRRDGLCILCGSPAINQNHCAKHAVVTREWQRQKVGSRRRYLGCASYGLFQRKMKTKTKTKQLLAITLAILCVGSTAFAQEIHSNVNYPNAIQNPPSSATFVVTSVFLPGGKWNVRCLANVRMVPTNPGHVEGLGLWAGIESLRLDGYSCLHSSLFSTWSFISCSTPGRIITVPQGGSRIDLLAATYYLPNRVSTVQVWGYISAVKQ